MRADDEDKPRRRRFRYLSGPPRDHLIGWSAAGFLLGCPQLLGDEFSTALLDLPDGSVLVGDDTERPDAGGGSGGAAGQASGAAGGSAGLTGTGGSGGTGSGPSPGEALRAVLAHRYSFDEVGTAVAKDSIGGADGVIVGTTIDSSGAVVLSDGAFVDLPNQLLSVLEDATLEVWMVWDGGTNQRIFDFGSNDGGEGAQGSGETYLFLTPQWATGQLRAGYTEDGVANILWIDGASTLVPGEPTHLALVVDSQANLASLYVDGQPDGTASLTIRLSHLNDVNNWLGRAQVDGHPDLSGAIDEFRIYDDALSAEQVQLSWDLGPDPVELD